MREKDNIMSSYNTCNGKKYLEENMLDIKISKLKV